MLTRDQRERFARQLAMPEIGAEGQKKLLAARVLVIGAGGLGSPAALYLTAAGVGTLGLADGDAVALSNLQRQILYSAAQIGRRKTEAAHARLIALSPETAVVTHEGFLCAETIQPIIRDYDFILDCTDRFAAKYLINDACVRVGKPFCHGGIAGFLGQLTTYVPGRGPCLRCLFPEPPSDGPDENGGPLGAICGVIGSLQAAEAVKYLLGAGDLLTGRLLRFDALRMEAQTVRVDREPGCPVCGVRPGISPPDA